MKRRVPTYRANDGVGTCHNFLFMRAAASSGTSAVPCRHWEGQCSSFHQHRCRRQSRPSLARGDGETVFRHACKLGLEGIVSKRKDSAYRSGRSPGRLKMKNANAPAVKREVEEDWGDRRRP